MADKAKLKAAFTQIEKQFGAGTVFRLGSSRRLAVKVIPTNILTIDIASGVGGVPQGRIIEIYGPESGGKTTLALQIVAEAQKAEGLAAFIDAEHALDPQYARQLGVDVDNLVVSQPDNGEQALEVAEALIRSEQFAVVVVDSVAALVPKAELEGQMGDAQMGLQARLMSQAMRKLNGVVSKTSTVLIFINQIRDKIGVLYGNPETTTGGKALKFYASMRITVRNAGHVKEGDRVVGCTTKVKFVKNKVSPPFREAEVSMTYGKGFTWARNFAAGITELGVVTKNKSWYSFQGENLANGVDQLVAMLEDPEQYIIVGKMKEAVKQALLKPPAPAPTEVPEPETEEKE